MFETIRKMLVILLISILSTFNHTKYILSGNQKCMTQPTLNNLHSTDYSHDLHYYPFAANLDRCA